ncbi:M24 family metallopeptidase [Novipirellula artificiosorum]|uniref:Putative peptidase n=1 Tax=Novipirellula artificiosorum TaxID=2528016 RepID=A0A5C6DUQ9_9BACT|nr:Xaa-Pro peptidase family protein [Novipirellula artificiosorum]TWU39657.1 putative peptidase [Novipirellula artificiosorum]
MNPRIEALRSLLDSLKVDAMLVTDEINVRYLSGFTGDSSYLLIGPSETRMLSDGRYEIQLAEECPGLQTLIRPPSQLLVDLVQEVINSSPYGPIGIEAGHVTLAQYREWCEKCPSVEWIETSSTVEQLRMVKDEGEIKIIREAVSIAERCFQSLMPMLTTKWTERQIAHELESRMRFLGAESASFKPIVALDAAAALPHYQPAEVNIPSTGTLLIDWGAKFQGYASDLTRTMTIGPISQAFQRVYSAVLEAQLAAIEAIRPGVEGKQVDAIARGMLEKAGFGNEFNHGLGHGIGLQIHESPRMSANCDQILQPGMIVTVEPGVYLRDQFGIRIEDDCLVTATGCEVLSGLAKGLDDCRVVL